MPSTFFLHYANCERSSDNYFSAIYSVLFCIFIYYFLINARLIVVALAKSSVHHTRSCTVIDRVQLALRADNSKYDVNLSVLNHLKRCKRTVLGCTVNRIVDDASTRNSSSSSSSSSITAAVGETVKLNSNFVSNFHNVDVKSIRPRRPLPL